MLGSGIVNAEQPATAANARGIDQIVRAGFDQHQLHHAGIHAKPIQCALLVQLVEAADAIVRRCVAQIQKVMAPTAEACVMASSSPAGSRARRTSGKYSTKPLKASSATTFGRG